MNDISQEELNPSAKKLLDEYLKSRVLKAFAIVGIINIGALFGIYTVVSETAAEHAVKKAISSTETQLQGLTKQLELLSSRTTDGFATALMSLGEAKAKVKAINEDILGLKSLKLEKVKEVTSLLNKSSSEIVNLIEAGKALTDITILKKSLDTEVLNIRKEIKSSNMEINKSISSLKKITVKYEDIVALQLANYNNIKLSGGGTVRTQTDNFGNDEEWQIIKK